MKSITLSVLLSLACLHGFSQRFMHGVGTGIFLEKSKGFDPVATGILTYSPRINVTQSEAMSLSLGIPLTIGFSGNYGSGYGSDYGSVNFMLNAPLILNVNIGAGSSKLNEDRVGFFVGGGFGYHYGTQTIYDSYYGDYSSSESTFGPAGNIGFRFAVGSHQKNIEARFSYMKGIADEYKPDIYGLAALFNF